MCRGAQKKIHVYLGKESILLAKVISTQWIPDRKIKHQNLLSHLLMTLKDLRAKCQLQGWHFYPRENQLKLLKFLEYQTHCLHIKKLRRSASSWCQICPIFKELRLKRNRKRKEIDLSLHRNLNELITSKEAFLFFLP